MERVRLLDLYFSFSLRYTPSQTCLPSGAAVCKFISYPLYNCSPPTTSPTTQATLTFNLLDGPGSLFAPSCDGMRHTQFVVLVAISTGFLNSRNLCGKHIQIKVASGREVVANVVGQCNSASGCRGGFAFKSAVPFEGLVGVGLHHGHCLGQW
ncbi:hypothetical protein QJS04_geneDACA000301 [Acorus gramineus]|uniref:Uncharacterized protein n=1 Tax=Acorus gramineus TaxID=55184 RepID=A0AAV9ASW7_ACOGR|nr:hypothetical protein QJS04_geneDACA000301 [Acorus gramineus]